MADRTPGLAGFGRLEESLTDLAGALEWPATPPLAEAVVQQVRMLPAPRPAPWLGGWPPLRWPGLTLRPARRGLALALVGVLLLAGVATAVGIALGGLRITFGEPPASLRPVVPASRALGREVSLAEARDAAGFTLVVPSLDELGPPDRVFFREPPAGGQVALAWGDRPGYAADPETSIGLVVTEFRADIGPETFDKLVHSGTRVEETQVQGSRAYWIEGGEHFIFYVDARGQVVETTIRLVGDTLIWEASGLTLRAEGAPSLEAAIRVAESMGE